MAAFFCGSYMSASTTCAPSSGQGASIYCSFCSVFAPRRESTSSQATSTRVRKRASMQRTLLWKLRLPTPRSRGHRLATAPCVGPRCMERPNCCGFVKLQHTSREWLKQNAWCPRCRSRHGPIQELPASLATTDSGYTSTPLGYLPPDGARSNRLKTSRTQRRHASGLAAPLPLFPRNRPVAQVRPSGLSVTRRQHSPHRCR